MSIVDALSQSTPLLLICFGTLLVVTVDVLVHRNYDIGAANASQRGLDNINAAFERALGPAWTVVLAVFVFLVVLQLVLGATGARRETPYVQVDAKLVDLTPWKPAPYVGGFLVIFAAAIYIYFMN